MTIDTSIINNDDSSIQECSTNDNNSLNVIGDDSLHVCNEYLFIMIQDEGNPNIDVSTNLPFTKISQHALWKYLIQLTPFNKIS